jgi:GST-like protein
VNIGKGERFAPDFLAIAPNNRMPAIVNHAQAGGGDLISKSGAILLYQAEKTGASAVPICVLGRRSRSG